MRSTRLSHSPRPLRGAEGACHAHIARPHFPCLLQAMRRTRRGPAVGRTQPPQPVRPAAALACGRSRMPARLNLSQSAVSRLITALEDDLRIALLPPCARAEADPIRRTAAHHTVWPDPCSYQQQSGLGNDQVQSVCCALERSRIDPKDGGGFGFGATRRSRNPPFPFIRSDPALGRVP